MNIQHQPHSYVKRDGNNLVSTDTAFHESTGTRYIQIQGTKSYRGAAEPDGGWGQQWMLPIFNVLNVPQGTTQQSRSGNSIYIHRIEVSYTVKENAGNRVGPEEGNVTNLVENQYQLTDPRMRILIVTPKSMYRYLPVSLGTNGKAVYPYFSESTNNDHPEPISKPVAVGKLNLYGMHELPDPKRYCTLYDDIRNLTMNSKIGHDSGSFSFLIRRQFNYDQDEYALSGRISMQDNELQKMLPQIWFYLPSHSTGGDTTTSSDWTNAGYDFEWSVRMIFDNKT